MKTGILILLTSLVWNLQLSGQMIPENVTLKQLDGKKITFKDAVKKAQNIIASGEAYKILEGFVKVTNE